MSWIERAYVGQKVVRVSGRDVEPVLYGIKANSYPRIGDVCTIKTMNVWPRGVIFTFYEHDNSEIQRSIGSEYEPGFGARYFRPVKDTAHQVEALKRLCNPTPEVVA